MISLAFDVFVTMKQNLTAVFESKVPPETLMVPSVAADKVPGMSPAVCADVSIPL
jgi:hypothetical protein